MIAGADLLWGKPKLGPLGAAQGLRGVVGEGGVRDVVHMEIERPSLELVSKPSSFTLKQNDNVFDRIELSGVPHMFSRRDAQAARTCMQERGRCKDVSQKYMCKRQATPRHLSIPA